MKYWQSNKYFYFQLGVKYDFKSRLVKSLDNIFFTALKMRKILPSGCLITKAVNPSINNISMLMLGIRYQVSLTLVTVYQCSLGFGHSHSVNLVTGVCVLINMKSYWWPETMVRYLVRSREDLNKRPSCHGLNWCHCTLYKFTAHVH